jgi:hypothetical protein
MGLPVSVRAREKELSFTQPDDVVCRLSLVSTGLAIHLISLHHTVLQRTLCPFVQLPLIRVSLLRTASRFIYSLSS